MEVGIPKDEFEELLSQIIFFSKGGVTMSDIDNLTINELLSYYSKFKELYKNEIEALSPLLLLNAMFGGK